MTVHGFGLSEDPAVLDGRRRFKGELVEFKDGVVHVLVDGKTVQIPYADIEKANVIYSFSSSDIQGESSE